MHLANQPGAFAALAAAIAEQGGLLDAIDLVRVERGHEGPRRDRARRRTRSTSSRIVEAVRALDGVVVEHVSDRTFLLHLGGKLEVVPKTPLKTRDDLSMAYTPGVARVSQAIADDPAKVWALTIKQNTVAVVSDGSAVLGLGDIGPEAALPVMEGKAVLFKEFGGVDAFPICLDDAGRRRDRPDRDRDRAGLRRRSTSRTSPSPRCFEIERRLRETLDIPIFHDDQHGTAIVVLAGLLNALRVVGKRLEDVRDRRSPASARPGIAVTKTLLAAGATRHRRLRPARRRPPRVATTSTPSSASSPR